MKVPTASTDPAGGVLPPDEAVPPSRKVADGAKGALTVVALLALLASAVVGSNVFGLRTRLFGSARPEPRPAAVSRLADSPDTTVELQPTELRSQPWWQGVTVLEGDGPATAPLTIDGGAVQWRVKWTCQSGRLVVVAPSQRRPVADDACPGAGTGYGTATGAVNLDVRAEGAWRMEVDQQVDVPLNEPPLPAMSAPGAVPVATGSFYRIDQTGTGTVTLYRLEDGRFAVRLDDFFVTANSELELRLSAHEEPKTSAQFMDDPSVLVAPLDVTAGSLNFTVPPEVDPTEYKSVVVWCGLIASAYSGATLEPAP